MKRESKAVIAKCCMGLTCAAMIAVCGMFMYGISKPVYYIAASLFATVAIIYCAVDGEAWPHVSRTVLVVAVILTVVAAGYMLYYNTGLAARFTDFGSIRKVIVDSGYWGFAVFVGLTVLQVILLPMPAAVMILLGVAIYGPTYSFILSTVGTILGSLIAFSLGRVFGRRLCNWMFGVENTEKYAKLLGDKGKFIFIIMLLFPAFPDDMLCMIAGITDMTYAYFALVCVLTRPVMIGFTAYLGSGAIPFSGWGIPVWAALVCLMFVAFIVITRLRTRIETGRPLRTSARGAHGRPIFKNRKNA